MRNLEKSLFLSLFLLATAGNLEAQTGIRMDVWQGATLTEAQDLANNPNLLGPPTSSTTLTGLFEGPMNVPGGNFVARYTGCLSVPASGTYYWWVVANRKAKLWLQLNTLNFVNKASHATSMSTPPPPARAWDYSASQRGIQIMSTTQLWCVMAVQIEDDGDGINHLAVGWYRPGTATEGYVRQYERPLSASRFTATGYPPPPSPMSITFDANPTTITAVDQQTNLSWNVTNATGCTASSDPGGSTWFGSKPLSGLQAITPFFTTTYHLTCTPTSGGASQTVSRTVTNTVYQQFTIAWDEVTTRADGSPLLNRGGYRIYILTSSGANAYSRVIDVGNVTSAVLDSSYFPTTGTYYMVVACYDTDNIVSGPSNEVSTFVWVPGT